MSHSFKFGYLFLVVGMLFSCSKTTTEIALVKLPKVKDKDLIDLLDSLASVKFQHFYSKISTKLQDSTQNVSFKTSVRIKSDSAINALITFAKIPVLNALLTKDSVTMTDKRSKCYVKESLDYIQDNYSIDFSYKNVEELILGLPINYDTNERYFQINDPYNYTISSHRKKDIKKNERRHGREIITYYTLSEDLKNLKSMRIESPEDSAIIQLDYLTRELIDGYLVPSDVNLYLSTPKKIMNIGLEYRKTRMNENEPIYFVIPESYERCE
jgi:hypothetical protein